MTGYTKEPLEGIVVIARMTALDGKRDALLDLLNEMVVAVAEHEPDGALTSIIHTSNMDPNAVVEYSHFSSRAAFDQHRANYTRVPIYSELRARLGSLLAKPIEPLEVASPLVRYIRTAPPISG